MIAEEQVKKIAHLARLEITPEEEKLFATQLNSILEYFEQLSELNTEGIAPTTRAIEISNITRSDVRQSYLGREQLLKAAPAQEGEFFKVPQILNSDEQ